MLHYVFTRFNLGWNPNDAIRLNNGKKVDPLVWLYHRVALFDRFFIPSVDAQSNKSFTVLLALSEHTPADIVDKYKSHPNIKIIYEYPADWLKKNLPADCDLLITTRIDNDDAFANDFIENIQKKSLSSANLPLILDQVGVQFDVASRRFLFSGYAMYRPDSHFLSVACNPNDGIRHVFEAEHGSISLKFANLYTNTSSLGWIEVIHEFNIGNSANSSEFGSLMQIQQKFKHISF